MCLNNFLALLPVVWYIVENHTPQLVAQNDISVRRNYSFGRQCKALIKITSDKTNDSRLDFAHDPAVVAKVKTIGAPAGGGI
jgi:hypothetical protein